jgi:hypothetical protein
MSNINFNTYLVVKNVQTAMNVINILRETNVKEDCIGVVSKDSEIALADLPELDASGKSKLPEALTQAALLGSGLGLMAGMLLITFPVAGVTLGGAAIASMAAGGAIFGAWSASMVGISAAIASMAAGGAVFGAWSASMVGTSKSSSLVAEFDHALKNEDTLIFCYLRPEQEKQVDEKINKAHIGGILKKGTTSD